MNAELERFWRGSGKRPAGVRCDEPRRHARELGFDYVENGDLIDLSAEKRLQRLEALVMMGLIGERSSREALLGTAKRASFKLSELFAEYEAITRDEIMDLSPDQLRIWRNGRIRAVDQFVRIVGDKQIGELTRDDGIDYSEWWRGRVTAGETAAKSANKDMGQLSRMLKDLSIRRRLDLPDIFKGLRLRGETEKCRLPYEPSFIQTRFLGGALASLNEEARFVLYVMIETGLRPSEIVNLTEKTIMLGDAIPHVRIVADGRRLKTDDSEREVPLVGVALEALKLRPGGFPYYRDKASLLSAAVNKFLLENELRPSKDHTVYSLRHSFKDRLVAAEAPDSLIDSLMGHKTYKPKYGKGPSLELKLKYLQRIAFTAPDSL